MANFLKVRSTGTGSSNTGDYLIGINHIVTVEAVSNTATWIRTVANDQASTAQATIRLIHTSTDGEPLVKDAVNKALAAKPGGKSITLNTPDGISITNITIVD